MIEVTRLNGEKFIINAMYIEKVQTLPDTTITLMNGKKYFVKDSEEEVYKKAMHFYQKIGLTNLVVKGENDK
ncbi:flagellar FlbD family protein [Salirhabdus salicampi]|nr:flagellar FlbD family protein [Salirhabdus salicampi]MCP8616515.1 flagellar FlbD family protein [Salirhabdus salicampi]